ncbi:hypothetical protein K435DRAFT_787800 [Dendrothele bispora CBS 962.96]|uniref:Uncharacterized protein n=1 Tax=Dendrothele bispora (strain CBS 962.96) TaxID=1314807 RepID=A0A4S8MYT9_DENBC|nr:hypothetical protein K435DRAFT_787800 [Dendrothele bispora CBS 962.96]
MSSLNSDANPQGLSNHKSSTLHADQHIASTTIVPDGPPPLSRQPTEPDYTPSHSSQQPPVEELERMGVKVRDFAYESVLPPIPSYRRHRRQVQPGPRPLKRSHLEDADEPMSQRSEDAREEIQGDEDPAGKADRKIADLFDRDVNSIPTRGRGYSDLNLYDFATESQQSEWYSPSHSQPPLAHGLESQDSEPYISTPFVTPNGSLQWDPEDTSAIPASQLDTIDEDILPSLEPGLIKKLSLHNSHDDFDLTPPRPQISLPSVSEAQTPPPKKRKPNPSPSAVPPKSPSPPPSLPSAPTSPRYQLRARRPAQSSPPTRGRSRSRATRRLVSPPSELLPGPPTSVQSSQSRSRSSSRPKTTTTSGTRSSTRLSRREK